MRRNLLPLLFVFLISCDQEGCESWEQIGEAISDDDEDGWFTDSSNQRVELIINDVTFIAGGGGLFPPVVKIVVEDRIVKDDTFSLIGQPVATRCLGTWRFEERVTDFTSLLAVTTGDPITAGVASIAWTNKDSTFTASVNGFTVSFETRVTRFADPSPNVDGDCDNDGILDSEEARLANVRNSSGNPMSPDAVLLVGFTHPDWRLTRNSDVKLTTVFARRNINLLVMADPNEIVGLTPGQISNDGEATARDFVIALDDVPPLRASHIAADLDSFVHFLVLAERLGEFGNCPEGGHGCAEVGGLNLVAKSHIATGPDIWDYQAKDIMHEFGHNLGLCHPRDQVCGTGVLPAAEQNSGTSAMGAPAEDEGNWLAMAINALSRPVDYSPTQWQNLSLRLSTGRAPVCP
jgi:hypothetical protein